MTTPLQSDSENSVDLSLLEQLRAMNPAKKPNIIETVIALFLKNTPETLRSIECSLENCDFIQTSKIAHKLKSSAGNIGAKPLIALLERLEFFGEKHPQDDRHLLLKMISEEFKKIETLLLRRQQDMPTV